MLTSKLPYKFDRVVCVSLARRQDRWQQFQSLLPLDWPFGAIELYTAIDGQRVSAPTWWKAGNSAWGCYKSHLNILEDCLNRQLESCLILEDDAICVDNFAYRAGLFFRELPDDWGLIYLGGQHLYSEQFPPISISDNVIQPFNVNRTHAYALRGQKMMEWVYQHLNKVETWQTSHHIDHHLGRAHQLRERPIYCPTNWLIGQDEGRSDISLNNCGVRFFQIDKTSTVAD